MTAQLLLPAECVADLHRDAATAVGEGRLAHEPPFLRMGGRPTLR